MVTTTRTPVEAVSAASTSARSSASASVHSSSNWSSTTTSSPLRRHGGGERLLEGAAWVVADRDLAQRLEQSGDGIGARYDHDDE